MTPPCAIGANALHELSGTGVLPVRAASATDVAAGDDAVHDRPSHLTALPASNTREVNVAAGAYGVRRTQSTATDPPPLARSLMSGRMLCVTVIAWVATTAPSTE